MPYTRRPLRGFRRFAMSFWRASRAGTIYGSMDIDVSKARRFQEDVKAQFGVWPSIAQLVGRAVAVALSEVPDANAKIIWGRPYTKDQVDVYFQVDVEDGRDLSGVVVSSADAKTAVDISRELSGYAGQLRSGDDAQYERTQKGCLGWMPVWMTRWMLGALTFCEYNLGLTASFAGMRPEPFGTVFVTNVSKFGIDQAYAPLVPVARVPFGVLVGRVTERPWVVDGQLAVRPVVTLNGTFDHRVIDGNKIGRITRAIRRYMENPYVHEPTLGLPDPDSQDTASLSPSQLLIPQEAADEEGAQQASPGAAEDTT